MSHYKIITDKDNIILKKKDNKFKLEANKKIKLPCDIINQIENYEIFNKLKLLNEDMLYKYKIINKDECINIILYIKNFLNDYYLEENYYITFTSKINKINDNHIILTGTKNDIDKDGYKKLQIDNIYMEIQLVNNELNVKFKFNTIEDEMPIYIENNIGSVFRKIFKNLIKHYSE
jgi:hypothetical protein